MTAKEAEKIKKEIDDISQKVPSSDNNDCTDSSCKTSSIFNSNNVGTDAKNNAGENVRQQSKQEVGKNPQDKEIRNIPGGSAVEIKPSPVQEKAMPVRLSGQAEVHVTQAEGGGETAEAARVVLEQVLPSALKCSCMLSGHVEITL